MIDGVGPSGPGRIGVGRSEQNANVVPLNPNAPARQSGAESAVFDLAQSGPPVDAEKVAAVRAAIAAGRYPVDAEKIAERMIALDLPSLA
jgi:negative regulator of flagellin synthesis FlgM